ncbi:hypothetical protein K3495_g10375 [Podosphaera aphanis]|nr:hypothetical protein K3495_g10375 [Podosphaera aphanis]
MTGQFSEFDPRRCAHYAKFFEHLNSIEANLIFWGLFGVVLILLCTVSAIHHKSTALSEATKKLPIEIATSEEHIISVRRVRIKYLSLVSLCLCVSATCLVFECFAAFHIEYCDGEDLMMLYWGFWSILQVGSNIAILGVMLQFWMVLGDVETPSWAVALGTPVLVFAALGFVMKEIWKKCWSRCLSRKKKAPEGPPILDKNVDDEEKGRGSISHRASTVAPFFEKSRASRISTSFWSRDVHYLMTSIINENPYPHRTKMNQTGHLSPCAEYPSSSDSERYHR